MYTLYIGNIWVFLNVFFVLLLISDYIEWDTFQDSNTFSEEHYVAAEILTVNCQLNLLSAINVREYGLFVGWL